VLDANGLLTLVAVAGSFPIDQLSLRSLGANGQPQGPTTFLAESGSMQPAVATDAAGFRAVAVMNASSELAVRLVSPTGQVVWRSATQTGDAFAGLQSVAFLGNGDIGVLYRTGFDTTAVVVGRRYARADGAPGNAVTFSTPPIGFSVGQVVSGTRIIAAIQAGLPRVACFDLAAGQCFGQPFAAGTRLGAITLDPTADTVYVTGTAPGATPRPRLTALDATAGSVRFDITLTDQAPGEGRAVFVRNGVPVLVATRTDGTDPTAEGLEFYTLSLGGELIERGSVNLGPRVVLREVAYHAPTDRAWLSAETRAADGSFATALAAVSMAGPSRIFRDGFD
jgi:hypothetical protein